VNLDVIMALRNIWRNPRRSVLTVLAIAFACLLLVFMLSFQFGSYETLINSSVTIHTGHLQVQNTGYGDNPDIRKVISRPETVVATLRNMQPVQAVSPRCQAFALASSRDRTLGTMVVGIDPTLEAEVSSLEDLIREGAYLTRPGPDRQLAGALAGRLLARNLQVVPGDEITLLGQGRDGSVAATVLEVRGIYASGLEEFDRQTLHIPLRTFQEVFFMDNAVHSVVVLADELNSVHGIKAALEENFAEQSNLVVLSWDEIQPGLKQAITLDLISGGIFYIILVLVVAFSILNTFLMTILERTREFGIMMAMGVKPGRLIRLVLLESVSMTLIGVFLGIGAGCLVTLYFQAQGIYLGGAHELLEQFGISGRIHPRLSLLSVSLGPGLVFGITFVSALYPALKVRKLSPVQAMTAV
jgi:ABC-type lipoprotein release transport system permease subunit